MMHPNGIRVDVKWADLFHNDDGRHENERLLVADIQLLDLGIIINKVILVRNRITGKTSCRAPGATITRNGQYAVMFPWGSKVERAIALALREEYQRLAGGNAKYDIAQWQSMCSR